MAETPTKTPEVKKEAPKKSHRVGMDGKGADGEALRLPKQPKQLVGADAERVRILAQQEKRGTVTLCNVKTDEGRCYFPLEPRRDPAHANDLMYQKDSDGKVGALALCSYDPKGHGEQYIYPPKKDEDL